MPVSFDFQKHCSEIVLAYFTEQLYQIQVRYKKIISIPKFILWVSQEFLYSRRKNEILCSILYLDL